MKLIHLTLFFCASFIIATSLIAHDLETTQLIQKLGSSKETDRIVARQLLPREGAAVVPDILPLLGHEDPNIWWTADKVLADIANEVSVPGRESERTIVAEQLMTLLKPDRPSELKERALRLLPIVLAEGSDVAPIATLLENDELRMKARDALQSIGTRQAVNALITSLLKSEKDFQIALLDSLDKVKHVNSINPLRGLSANTDPEIRITAARGLARWGILSDLELFQWMWQERTPETEFGAGNAYLLYVDEIAARGGNTELAVSLYKTIFNESEDTVLTGAAMMGMAKYGDSRVVEPLFSILERESRDQLIPQFLNALAVLRGTGANQAVVDRFELLPEDLKGPVIGILGRKKHPVFLPLLTQLTDSNDPEIQSIAFSALADSKLPQAVEVLSRKVLEGDEESRGQALAVLIDLADSLVSEGNRIEAGKAYSVILDSVHDNDSRKTALVALAQFPDIEAFDSVTQLLGNPNLQNEVHAALASITKSLAQSNQKDRANQGFELLLKNSNATEDFQRLGELAHTLGRSSEFLSNAGFPIEWKLIGPFPWLVEEGFSVAHIGEPGIDTSNNVSVAEKKIAWKDHQISDRTGQVFLDSIYGPQENVSVYAVTRFKVANDQDATLRIGSDDWVKVWLNEEPVHEFTSFRGVALDQDQVPVTLKEGVNTLLLRINQGALGYGFVVRITDRDGKPIQVE